MKNILIDSRYISKFMERYNLTISSLAKLCKINIVALKNIIQNKTERIIEEDIKKLASYMNVSFETIVIDLNSRY